MIFVFLKIAPYKYITKTNNMTTKLEKIEYVTKQALINLLTNFKKEISATGVAFGNVVYHVDESGSRVKKGKKMLQKLVRTNVTIGANYEGRVNRDLVRQEEEANFTAQAMSGKRYVNDEGVLAMDEKTGTKNYLVAVVEHNTKPKAVYFHEGKRITKAKAVRRDMFMDSYFEPKKTSGRGNMSEEKDFHFFTLGVEKIIEVVLGGIKYIIED